MNVPPVIYGALGGVVVTSLMWIASSTPGEDKSAEAAGQTSPPTPRAPLTQQDSDWSPQFPAGTRPSDVSPLGRNNALTRDTKPFSLPSAVRDNTRPPEPATPPATTDRPPTREQLAHRAEQVEQHANAELSALAERLGLTETQQDRIFPILANASPAFHPSLHPEGGEVVYGDGIAIDAGAPIAAVESEIFPELDEIQQSLLAEEAMDREAWWEDIVGQLESDLEDSTDPSAIAGGDTGGSQPASSFTDEEREAAAATNQASDFSDLFQNR